MDGTGDRSKVQFCKEQYCIGTCTVRSMNQGKLELVKQEKPKMFSVHFQGKPFNIMVIQVYALTRNAEEAEVE